MVDFSVSLWNSRKTDEIITAFNYKKCDKEGVRVNKINKFRLLDLGKSAVRFNLYNILGYSWQYLKHTPPFKICVFFATLSPITTYKLEQFLKVVLGVYLGGKKNYRVYSFEKVGGAGGGQC